MTQWEVLLVFVVIVEFIALVIKNFVDPSNKRNLHVTQVIQKNTDAIENLTKEITKLTTDNKKEHDEFSKSINKLKHDVGLLKQKHESDMELINQRNRRED